MFTIIAFASLIIFIISVIFAIIGIRQLYWVSAVSIYIFSFLAGFSIGQISVGLTFVFLALAIGYSFGWIKGKMDYLFFAGGGLIIGAVIVIFVDDYWTFFPFWVF